MDKDNSLVFIVDDDEAIRESLSQMLLLHGHKTIEFDSGEALLASRDLDKASCFVIDVLMPGMSGIELLEKLVDRQVKGPVVIITGHGDVPMAVGAMGKGAYDFVEKPFEGDVVLASITRAVEKGELSRQTQFLREELERVKSAGDEYYGLLGESEAIVEVRKKIASYADSEISILISGETGTGKELVARALHNQSSRKNGRFVAVNLASLPETLAMSELFGYEKGAFTGAEASRKGKFEYASGGTLLLDEINSASKAIQAGILRAVEEKSVTRLGSNETISVDTRIVATTNEDIQLLISKGTFRNDLFHRLSEAVVDIPPLRERPEDIPILAMSFLEESCNFYDKGKISFSAEVINKLRSYAWPGNVRELKNVVVSLVLRCGADEITHWESSEKNTKKTMRGSLKDSVDNFEKESIIEAMRQCKGNVKAVTASLNIPRRSLFDKMRKYRLDKEDYK